MAGAIDSRADGKSEPVTWVVGAGGLIGGAVVLENPAAFAGLDLDWSDDDRVRDGFEANGRDFRELAAGRPWRVLWAAGIGVISSPESVITRDAVLFYSFLDVLGRTLPEGPGVVTLVSSAGGIFGGSVGGPFNEDTVPRPISPYGHGKLRQENALSGWGASLGVPVAIARTANVYGARQDLGKPQGLISHACAAALANRPINIFVPLHTRRHYVYADDVGTLLESVASVAATDGNAVFIKNLAGGPPTSISRILEIVGDVHGAPLDVQTSSTSHQAIHPVDVILASNRTPAIDAISLTPIEAGIAAVYGAMAASRPVG